VHRGDLHGVLLKACRDDDRIELRTGCEIVGYEQNDRAATIRLASGERVRGADRPRGAVVQYPQTDAG